MPTSRVYLNRWILILSAIALPLLGCSSRSIELNGTWQIIHTNTDNQDSNGVLWHFDDSSFRIEDQNGLHEPRNFSLNRTSTPATFNVMSADQTYTSHGIIKFEQDRMIVAYTNDPNGVPETFRDDNLAVITFIKVP